MFLLLEVEVVNDFRQETRELRGLRDEHGFLQEVRAAALRGFTRGDPPWIADGGVTCGDSISRTRVYAENGQSRFESNIPRWEWKYPDL